MPDTKKILVIDDEEDLLEVLESVLSGQGYEIITCTNGRDGIEYAKEHNPDLIMLDIAMPGMDGLEVLSRLRGDRKTATIPVVMLTAKGSTENIMQADQHRAVEFLIKPIPTTEFLDIVKRYVR